MYEQRDYIRDFVFPIAMAQKSEQEYMLKLFLGSGFLFGNKGFALTASHVIEKYANELLITMFVGKDNKWYVFEVLNNESHPKEDIAILKINGGPWKSPFRMRNKWEGSSARYQMFGYPEDAVYDIVDSSSSKVTPRPDLVYTEGYIRRRISFNPGIPNVKGDNFFEVSEIAGRGCSGSPLYINNNRVWDVIGIYVGEKVNDRGTSVSYAVREDVFRSWSPAILGTSIINESQNFSI